LYQAFAIPNQGDAPAVYGTVLPQALEFLE
jgi:hypothetical protein